MLVENVKALQQAQKEMANAISVLDGRIRNMEADMRAIKAEAKVDALKETQQVLNAVQGAFNDKLTGITVQVSHLEGPKAPFISLAKSISSDGAAGEDQPTS